MTTGANDGPFSVHENERKIIWYEVADIKNPTGEPFVVMRIDTSIRRDNGVEGTVMSLHWQRDEAEARAFALTEECANG